jgi:hypothetical protein
MRQSSADLAGSICWFDLTCLLSLSVTANGSSAATMVPAKPLSARRSRRDIGKVKLPERRPVTGLPRNGVGVGIDLVKKVIAVT